MAKKGFIPWNAGTSKTKVEITCECCGNIIERYLHGRKKVRFCSNKCAHIVMSGNNHPSKGFKPSKETRQKMRMRKIGIKHSPEHKKRITSGVKNMWINMNAQVLRDRNRKIREKTIKNIEKRKLNGLPMIPNMGKHENHILSMLESCFNYSILRQYKINGYFLDGYCPALNLAIEVDELYHKNKETLKKDKVRENEIKEVLGCNFLRINV